MATLNMTSSMTVGELKKQFKEAFGSSLRVYKGGRVADDSLALSEIGLKADGALECRSSLTVAGFISRMMNDHGLKVKVYTCDEWVACLDGLTLEATGKVKKNAVKADMESMIAYKRNEDSQEDNKHLNENVSGECTVDGIEYEIIDSEASAYFDNEDNRASIIIPDFVLFREIQCPVVDVELSCGKAKKLELGKNVKYLMGGSKDFCKLESVIVHSSEGFLESGFDDCDVLSFIKVPIQYKG